MSNKYDEIPVVTKDGDASLIHVTDHGNPENHPNPHAHDVNIPRAQDEKYLDPPRGLNFDEIQAYNNYLNLKKRGN